MVSVLKIMLCYDDWMNILKVDFVIFIDQRNLMDHCKVLSLAHCHSFVVAAYKSLVLQQPLGYDDMDAAVEQCEECLIEINITDYLRAVCKHLDSRAGGEESPCSEMRNIHNLIKDKFKKIINVAFKQVPVHPDFYFCLPSWKSDKMVCLLIFDLRLNNISGNYLKI